MKDPDGSMLRKHKFKNLEAFMYSGDVIDKSTEKWFYLIKSRCSMGMDK